MNLMKGFSGMYTWYGMKKLKIVLPATKIVTAKTNPGFEDGYLNSTRYICGGTLAWAKLRPRAIASEAKPCPENVHFFGQRLNLYCFT
jgi:hypothetical protein